MATRLPFQPLDAHSAYPPFQQEVVENDPGHENGGKHARNDADGQRHSKAPHGSRTELEKNDGRDERRDVGVENGEGGPRIAVIDRRPQGLPEPQFLADSLRR